MRRVRRIVLTTLVVALIGYIAWDRVESYRLSRAIDAIAARGEPVSFDHAFPEPKTQEQRDAASLYLQAVDLALDESAADNNRASRLDVDKPGGTELSLADIRASYRADDPALQLLDRATPMDFRGFDAEQRGATEYRTSTQQGLLALGQLACLRADLLSVAGEGDAAAAELVACVRLERTLEGELSRVQLASRIAGSVRIIFRHTSPSDASLLTLQRAMESWSDQDRAVQSVMLDRAFFIDIARSSIYQSVVQRIAYRLAHPFVLRGVRAALASYDGPLATAALPPADRVREAEERQRAAFLAFQQHPAGLFGRLVSPIGTSSVVYGSLSRSVMMSAYELAARRVVAATLAVERYRRAHAGAAPSSLTALAPAFLANVPQDPFSGAALIYHQDANGYVIYSVDSNHKDDGGILYGFGAAPAKFVGPQSPRDYGIHVPLTPAS